MLKIPPDFSAVSVQIALFVGLWLVLKYLWFEPALRILKAREQRSHGAIVEARALQEEAQRLRAQHAAALEQAKSDAQREVQEILRHGEAEQRQLIAAATEDAQRTVAEMRSRVAEEVARARAGLRREVQAIAREMAKAVLGRAV